MKNRKAGLGSKKDDGVGGGKRKSMSIDSEMDGDDTKMDELEANGKRTKIQVDGNCVSLTVAEVGINQPREGQ